MPSRIGSLIDRVKSPLRSNTRSTSTASGASSPTTSESGAGATATATARQRARVSTEDKQLDKEEKKHRREVEKMYREKRLEQEHVSAILLACFNVARTDLIWI